MPLLGRKFSSTEQKKGVILPLQAMLDNIITVFRGGYKARLILFCLIAAFYTLSCNHFSRVLFSFDMAEWKAYSLYMVISFTYCYAFFLSLILLAGVSRVVAYGVLPLCSMIQFAAYYARTRYGACDIPAIVYSACDTTWEEASVYINFRSAVLFSCMMMSAFCLGYILRRLSPIKPKWKNILALLVTTSFLLSIPIVVKSFFPSIAKAASRYYILEDLMGFYMTNSDMDYYMDKKVYAEMDVFSSAYFPSNAIKETALTIYSYYFPPVLPDATPKPSRQVRKPLPQAVVLFIGESFRSDHSPFNGYYRNTLPRLSEEKNIINLPALHSRKTSTIQSIYSILTDTNPKTLQPDHGSFLGIIKKHGMGTSLLVSQNTEGKWWQFPTIYPLLDGKIDYMNRPETDKDYQEELGKIQQNGLSQFILIEDGTGHLPYRSQNKVFGNSDSKDWVIEDVATMVDCYDNCLLDTDARLSSIIEALRDKDAILIYTSDHGESFGEGGFYVHGGPVTRKEQTHVFAFIWYSDTYKERRPEIVEALRQNAGRFVSHDYIYHTIISMCGLASDVQRLEQDMTRPQPQ